MLTRFLGAQWLAIGFNGALSFGLSVLIARNFGPELFGVYATAISLGALFSVLVDGGFSKLIQREAARATPELAAIPGGIPAFAFGHALLVVLGAVFVVLLLPFHLPTIVATLVAFGSAAMAQFGLSVLRGQGRFVKDASWQIFSRLLTAICVVAVLCLGANQPWQILTAQFVGTAAFVFFITGALAVRPVFRIPVRLYQALLPLVWLDLATIIYFRADMLLFKLMDVPRVDVGYYGVAYRLIEAFLLLASPVSLILFRKFRIASASVAVAIRQMLLPVVVSGLIGLIIALVLWFFGGDFISLAYGHDFSPAGRLLGILGCLLIFALANGVLSQAALAVGLERWCAVSATCAAVINVAGNYLLLPEFGVEAAAWMTVATEIVLGGCVSIGLYLKWRSARSVLIGN